MQQSGSAQEFLTTSEVADFLRIKERTVYELVRKRRIPCSRVTGRLLFPRSMVEAWVRAQVEYEGPALKPAPPVIAGSHDPLLEWAVRESGCDLALMGGGSSDGLRRLELGQAVAAGLHLIDPGGGDYNMAVLRTSEKSGDLALIHWAWRQQGLITARGNPKKIRSILDLKKAGIVVARRQEGAGSQVLLRYLLETASLSYRNLKLLEPAMRTETDVATAVLDGKADCGLAIEAVARRHKLGFIPLQLERFDLAVSRRHYFEEPLQRLVWFTRGPDFSAHAAQLGGYDVSETGRIVQGLA
ncbi:MAG TPA: helix-turn-helix transcriptional regulator [Alphaproteobacteria bacterium]|nr:helix-turn-helix transcriptional regulator [Alphaproteobacteria bacterium]